MAWTYTKTDWNGTNYFNFSDYNRIKNNIAYLAELAEELFSGFHPATLRDDINSYAYIWNPDDFNALEDEIEKIYIFSGFNVPIGEKGEYGYNSVFVTYNDLNRIESACLNMRNRMENQKKAKTMLSFTLGGEQF